ncbi:hypothetical protein A2U01_0090795, partial [Trifolium medium]|nr:hypothetical protein [Trifolium medium]
GGADQQVNTRLPAAINCDQVGGQHMDLSNKGCWTVGWVAYEVKCPHIQQDLVVVLTWATSQVLLR